MNAAQTILSSRRRRQPNVADDSGFDPRPEDNETALIDRDFLRATLAAVRYLFATATVSDAEAAAGTARRCNINVFHAARRRVTSKG